MKARNALVPVMVAVFICIAVLLTSYGLRAEKGGTMLQSLRLFSEILTNAQSKYVRPIDAQKLIRTAIDAMLNELDPHTVYMDEEEFKELRIGTKGEFGGLGITIGLTKEILTVISPLEGTPAFRAGIIAGDKIVKIEGKSTKGITLKDAVKKLRGKPGTKVNISVQREGLEELLEFTIERAIIKIKPVPYSGMVSKDIGYIRLARFSRDSGIEVGRAVDSLRTVGARRFIIDIRNNSGGLLDQAVQVSDVFLEKGEEIVSTGGRIRGSNRRFHAIKTSRIKDAPLVILVNKGSASASEILSGAVQDWDRGLVVGTPTFGKGSVQTIIPISSGGGLKLTTAEWYTPSGRLINKPHNLDEDETAVVDSIALSLDEDEAPKVDSTARSLEEFHTIGGLKRIVYGGGGITPDIELTSPAWTKFGTELYNKRRFFDFSVKYTATHKNLKRPFKAAESILDEFKSYLKDNDVTPTTAELDSTLEFISWMIEQEVSSSLWGTSGRYEAMLSGDTWVKEAIALLEMSHAPKDLFALAEKEKASAEK